MEKRNRIIFAHQKYDKKIVYFLTKPRAVHRSSLNL